MCCDFLFFAFGRGLIFVFIFINLDWYRVVQHKFYICRLLFAHSLDTGGGKGYKNVVNILLVVRNQVVYSCCLQRFPGSQLGTLHIAFIFGVKRNVDDVISSYESTQIFFANTLELFVKHF